MRFVQGGRMQDRLYALHAMPNERTVGDGAGVGSKRCAEDVDADHLVAQALQGAYKRFAKVPGTAGN